MFLEICLQFIPWYLHQVDKLTNKKYAKTINIFCADNKVFVKCQAQTGVNPKPPLRTPLAYCTFKGQGAPDKW